MKFLLERQGFTGAGASKQRSSPPSSGRQTIYILTEIKPQLKQTYQYLVPVMFVYSGRFNVAKQGYRRFANYDATRLIQLYGFTNRAQVSRPLITRIQNSASCIIQNLAPIIDKSYLWQICPNHLFSPHVSAARISSFNFLQKHSRL